MADKIFIADKPTLDNVDIKTSDIQNRIIDIQDTVAKESVAFSHYTEFVDGAKLPIGQQELTILSFQGKAEISLIRFPRAMQVGINAPELSNFRMIVDGEVYFTLDTSTRSSSGETLLYTPDTVAVSDIAAGLSTGTSYRYRDIATKGQNLEANYIYYFLYAMLLPIKVNSEIKLVCDSNNQSTSGVSGFSRTSFHGVLL